MTLTIVGLGPGDLDDLTRKAWRVLKSAETIYLRTERHGCVSCLPQTGAAYRSFDHLYEAGEDFESVYAAIVAELLEAAAKGDVVYAVPGDPLVGESTTTRLLAAAQSAGVTVEIVNGISFVEPVLAAVGVDALDGLQIIDGLEIAALYHPPVNPDYPALIGQVYSRAVASDIKLTLMNQYPDDFPVTLVHDAGTPAMVAEHVPLYEIDRSDRIAHTTSLYLPALGDMAGFEAAQGIIAHLRAPEGCPWDREQTHESLRPFLLEETYEVLEAIDEGDTDALAEELGDVLLQILLHAQIAIEDGEFYMTDVLRTLNHKMIRRHPHVWSTAEVDGSAQVVANWQELKKQEKADKGQEVDESLLAGVPKGLPALLQSYQYQARAAKVAFDWDDIADVRAKVDEEMGEVLAVLDDPDELAKEFGDLLFALVNWARWLKVEPEDALRNANRRFARRFAYVEQSAAASGRLMTDHTLDELDAYWNEAKARGL